MSQSAYGNALAGSIVHISPEGVKHRVYLEHDSRSSEGVFLDKESHIRMVVEEYSLVDGVATPVSTRFINGAQYYDPHQREDYPSSHSFFQNCVKTLAKTISPAPELLPAML